MRIGLFLGEVDTLDNAIRNAVQAEADGFESAWYAQIFRGDALTGIAFAGRETSRIELGTSVLPTYPRHPYVMAQQAKTVQAATGGRLTLGIGLSHHPVVEGMWGMSYDRPALHMQEYLTVLRALLDDGRASFQGEVFQVNASLQFDAPRVPLLIAALAPVMLRIAGELAGGTVTWMTGVKAIREHISPRIRKAATGAGRPEPRIVACLPVAVTDDAAAARAKAAQIFQMYGQLPNYRRVLDRGGAAGPGDVVLVGNEADVERQVRDLASAGATDLGAIAFPADDTSMPRTRELLKGLIGKV
jgi:F420-dependent oxidoreductase-like protein